MKALVTSLRWMVAPLLAAAACAQPTLNVPAQFATIQAAIVAATNGATVLVAPGTYNESLNFLGKAITVRGSQGAAATSIAGTSAGRVVRFVTNETAATVLDGFTIRGGNGGILIQNASPAIRHCAIIGNNETGATSGGGIRIFVNNGTTASPSITDCSIEANWTSGFGGGIGVDVTSGNATPAITDCRIRGNTTVGTAPNSGGGGISLIGTSTATILRCDIDDNSVLAPGAACGGIYATNGGNLTVTACRIRRNHSNTNAGAFGWNGGTQTFVNCLVAENSAPVGGVATFTGTTRFSNCTIVRNVSYGTSPPVGGLSQNCVVNSVTIENSIVWGNSGLDFYLEPGCAQATTSITHSNIGTTFVPLGTGCISADPLFADPDHGDFHLSSASPCRNAGNPTAANLPAADLDGTPRVAGGVVDMGCDEFPASTLAGTNEDLDLLTWIDGAGDPQATLINPLVGQTVRVRLSSLGGTFVGAPPLLVAQGYAFGSPPSPVPGFPAIRIDPFSSFTVLFGAVSPAPFPAPGLPAAGLSFDAQVPPGLLGTVIRVQGFAVTPSAANALFAATGARDVVLP